VSRAAPGGDGPSAAERALALRALVAAPGAEAQRAVIAGLLSRPEPVTVAAVLAALARREAIAAVAPEQVEACAAALAASGTALHLPGRAGYPSRLAQAWPELGAPAWLLVQAPGGRLPEQPTVGVIGTRRPTLPGRRLAAELGRRLAEAGVCVVSGLARGIDQAAHRGALEAEGATVGVAGCGLDVDYPQGERALRAAIAHAGGLVSELPPGTPPRPHRFLARNRIIAGLCDAVVVVEGPARSGALHTARLAAAQGREVWAAPGNLHAATAQAPLALIRDGAHVLTALDDLIAAVVTPGGAAASDGAAPGGTRPAAHPAATARRRTAEAGLGPEEREILALLDPAEPASLGALAEAAGLAVPAVTAAVGALVTGGLARQTAQGVTAAQP